MRLLQCAGGSGSIPAPKGHGSCLSHGGKPSMLSPPPAACPPFLWGDSEEIWSLAQPVQRRKRVRASPGENTQGASWGHHPTGHRVTGRGRGRFRLSIRPGLGENMSLPARADVSSCWVFLPFATSRGAKTGLAFLSLCTEGCTLGPAPPSPS